MIDGDDDSGDGDDSGINESSGQVVCNVVAW